MSFGFKNGIPIDADMVFDVRFLPNPHWVPALRPQSGLSAAGAPPTCWASRTRSRSSSTPSRWSS